MIVQTYKDKGLDVQDSANYREIKLMSHAQTAALMKGQEKKLDVAERKMLWYEVGISKTKPERRTSERH